MTGSWRFSCARWPPNFRPQPRSASDGWGPGPEDCAGWKAFCPGSGREFPHRVDHDLESALAAAEPRPGQIEVPGPGRAGHRPQRNVGSCCYGRNRRGQTAKVGRLGPFAGGSGSAYDIAFRALREAAHEFDHFQTWSRFGQQALRACPERTQRPDRLASIRRKDRGRRPGPAGVRRGETR